MELVNRLIEMNKRLIIALVAFSLCIALTISTIVAKASTGEPVVESTETILEVDEAKSSTSESDVAKLSIAANSRSVAVAKVKAAKDAGRCKTISGQEAINMGVVTQGYMGTGTGFAQENRQTTMCDTDGDGNFDTRGECGNALRVTNAPQPEQAKATVWVEDFDKATAKISVTAKAKAYARCETSGASAIASASASSKASVRVKIKTLTKAGGKVSSDEFGKVKAKAVSQASADAKAKAKAKASAETFCQSSEAITTSSNVTPGQLGEVAPTSLPDTGPGAVISAFVGVSSLGSLAYSKRSRIHDYLSRRFGGHKIASHAHEPHPHTHDHDHSHSHES